MTLSTVIAGTMGLACLAFVLFMIAVFGGGAAANLNELSTWEMMILDSSLFVLPGLCIVAATMVWVAYLSDWAAAHYWWFAFPLPFVVAYLVYVSYYLK